jgi:hypothetical protein
MGLTGIDRAWVHALQWVQHLSTWPAPRLCRSVFLEVEGCVLQHAALRDGDSSCWRRWRCTPGFGLCKSSTLYFKWSYTDMHWGG